MSAEPPESTESPVGEPTPPQPPDVPAGDLEMPAVEPEQDVDKPATPQRFVNNNVVAPADSKFQKKIAKYIERTEKGIEKLTERQALSGQEFDKQIVALAGGGLALTITLAKDFLDKGAGWLGFLFASWGAFLLALTANLVSHQISATHYDLMIQRQQHYLNCAEEETDVDEDLEGTLTQRINSRTKWVNGLNLGALITCLSGIVFFIIFTFYNKYHSNGRPGTQPTATAPSVHPRPNQRNVGHERTTHPAPPATAGSSDTTSRATGGKMKK